MAEITPIEHVRERCKDEHFLQNMLLQHDAKHVECEQHEAKIRGLEGRLGDLSNENAQQKREIEALKDERADLKKQVAELQAKIVEMDAHPDVKAAKVIQAAKRVEFLKQQLAEADTAHQELQK